MLSLLLIVVLSFGLIGCKKCVDTKYEDVEVVIVGEYYEPMWTQPMLVGKVTTVITHPPVYEITVDYNGVEYTINDSYTYEEYKDKVGQSVIGVLEICSYDDGSVRYDIKSLE
jgi:hypothetical protein